MNGFTELEREVVSTLRNGGYKATWNGNVIETGSNHIWNRIALRRQPKIYIFDHNLVPRYDGAWVLGRGESLAGIAVVINDPKKETDAQGMYDLLRAYVVDKYNQQEQRPQVMYLSNAEFRQRGGTRGLLQSLSPDIAERAAPILLERVHPSRLKDYVTNGEDGSMIVDKDKLFAEVHW